MKIYSSNRLRHVIKRTLGTAKMTKRYHFVRNICVFRLVIGMKIPHYILVRNEVTHSIIKNLEKKRNNHLSITIL
jgi:hypothetical protein